MLPFGTRFRRPPVVGLLCMEKKAHSPAMKEILSRLTHNNDIQVKYFTDNMLLNDPIDKWPRVDVIIGFHSKGFPLQKAIEYEERYRPHSINSLRDQVTLLSRFDVYDKLDTHCIPTCRHVILRRQLVSRCDYCRLRDGEVPEAKDGVVEAASFPQVHQERARPPSVFVSQFHTPQEATDRLRRMSAKEAEFHAAVTKEEDLCTCVYEDPPGTVITDDYVEINKVRLYRPFVEKPADADDHQVHIYFTKDCKQGEGVCKLFRKVGNRSSAFFPGHHDIRRKGSYVYEEFMHADDSYDVKIYSILPNYVLAETRKAPHVDGHVERDPITGKEVRTTTVVTEQERDIAKLIGRVFRQRVCGFDILRCNGKSYVVDVNGWSFVKTNPHYYDTCASILRNLIFKATMADQMSLATMYGFGRMHGYSHDHVLVPGDAAVSLRTASFGPGAKEAAKKSGPAMIDTDADIYYSREQGSYQIDTQFLEWLDSVAARTTLIRPDSKLDMMQERATSFYPTYKGATLEKKAVVAVYRHADRAPKFKYKFESRSEKIYASLSGMDNVRSLFQRSEMKSGDVRDFLAQNDREEGEIERAMGHGDGFDPGALPIRSSSAMSRDGSIIADVGRLSTSLREIIIKPEYVPQRAGEIADSVGQLLSSSRFDPSKILSEAFLERVLPDCTDFGPTDDEDNHVNSFDDGEEPGVATVAVSSTALSQRLPVIYRERLSRFRLSSSQAKAAPTFPARQGFCGAIGRSFGRRVQDDDGEVGPQREELARDGLHRSVIHLMTKARVCIAVKRAARAAKLGGQSSKEDQAPRDCSGAQNSPNTVYCLSKLLIRLFHLRKQRKESSKAPRRSRSVSFAKRSPSDFQVYCREGYIAHRFVSQHYRSRSQYVTDVQCSQRGNRCLADSPLSAKLVGEQAGVDVKAFNPAGRSSRYGHDFKLQGTAVRDVQDPADLDLPRNLQHVVSNSQEADPAFPEPCEFSGKEVTGLKIIYSLLKNNISGTKIQIKPGLVKSAPKGEGEESFDTLPQTYTVVVKWGGYLTQSGFIQAFQSGRTLRKQFLLPDETDHDFDNLNIDSGRLVYNSGADRVEAREGSQDEPEPCSQEPDARTQRDDVPQQANLRTTGRDANSVAGDQKELHARPTHSVQASSRTKTDVHGRNFFLDNVVRLFRTSERRVAKTAVGLLLGILADPDCELDDIIPAESQFLSCAKAEDVLAELTRLYGDSVPIPHIHLTASQLSQMLLPEDETLTMKEVTLKSKLREELEAVNTFLGTTSYKNVHRIVYRGMQPSVCEDDLTQAQARARGLGPYKRQLAYLREAPDARTFVLNSPELLLGTTSVASYLQARKNKWLKPSPSFPGLGIWGISGRSRDFIPLHAYTDTRLNTLYPVCQKVLLKSKMEWHTDVMRAIYRGFKTFIYQAEREDLTKAAKFSHGDKRDVQETDACSPAARGGRDQSECDASSFESLGERADSFLESLAQQSNDNGAQSPELLVRAPILRQQQKSGDTVSNLYQGGPSSQDLPVYSRHASGGATLAPTVESPRKTSCEWVQQPSPHLLGRARSEFLPGTFESKTQELSDRQVSSPVLFMARSRGRLSGASAKQATSPGFNERSDDSGQPPSRELDADVSLRIIPQFRFILSAFSADGNHFNVSKLTDIYECLVFVATHFLKLTETRAFQNLFRLVSTYANTVTDLSYGITSNKKIELGYAIASPLLGVMVDDLKSKIPLKWLTQKYADGKSDSLEYRDASDPGREPRMGRTQSSQSLQVAGRVGSEGRTKQAVAAKAALPLRHTLPGRLLVSASEDAPVDASGPVEASDATEIVESTGIVGANASIIGASAQLSVDAASGPEGDVYSASTDGVPVGSLDSKLLDTPVLGEPQQPHMPFISDPLLALQTDTGATLSDHDAVTAGEAVSAPFVLSQPDSTPDCQFPGSAASFEVAETNLSARKDLQEQTGFERRQTISSLMHGSDGTLSKPGGQQMHLSGSLSDFLLVNKTGQRLDIFSHGELTPQVALAAQAAQLPHAYGLPQSQPHHVGPKVQRPRRASIDGMDSSVGDAGQGPASLPRDQAESSLPPVLLRELATKADKSASSGVTANALQDQLAGSPPHTLEAKLSGGQAGRAVSADQHVYEQGAAGSVSNSLLQPEPGDETEASTAQFSGDQVGQTADLPPSFISRIYCSDEAHLYAILNMLTLSDDFRPYLVRDRSSIYPLNYLSSITFVLYEMRVPGRPPRYLVEVYFSQGESSDVFQPTRRNAIPVDVPELLMRPVPFHIITGLNNRIFRQCRQQSDETLVTVLGIYRHADRSPKQRLKFPVEHQALVYRLMVLLGVDMQAPKDLTIWADKSFQTLVDICDAIESELNGEGSSDFAICSMPIPAAMRQSDDEYPDHRGDFRSPEMAPAVGTSLCGSGVNHSVLRTSPSLSTLSVELSQLAKNLLVFIKVVRARPPALKVQLKFPAPWKGTLKFTLIAKYGGTLTLMGMRQAILCGSLMYQALYDGLALQKAADEWPEGLIRNSNSAEQRDHHTWSKSSSARENLLSSVRYYRQCASGMHRFFQNATVYFNDEPRVKATAQSYVDELRGLVEANIQFIRESISRSLEGPEAAEQEHSDRGTDDVPVSGGTVQQEGGEVVQPVSADSGESGGLDRRARHPTSGSPARSSDSLYQGEPGGAAGSAAPAALSTTVLEGEIQDPLASELQALETELQLLQRSVSNIPSTELDILSKVSKLARQIMNDEKGILNTALISTVNLANTSYRDLDSDLKLVVRNVPQTAIEDLGVPAVSLKVIKGLLCDLVDQYRALSSSNAIKRAELARKREAEAMQRLEAIKRESALSYSCSMFVGAETSRFGDGEFEFDNGDMDDMIGQGFSDLVSTPHDQKSLLDQGGPKGQALTPSLISQTSAASPGLLPEEDGQAAALDILPDGETLEMAILRIETVLENFNAGKSGTYDLSKISDIVDMLRYEILQHHVVQTPQIQATIKKAWDVSDILGKFTLSSEYGLTEFRKYAIGSLICDSLLDAIVRDLGSPGLHLYFTSESHIYGLLNLLLYTPSSKCQLDKSAVQNVDFMSHFIVKVYSKGRPSNISRIEVFWSSGSAHSPYKLDPTSKAPLLRIQTPILLGDDFSREDFEQLQTRTHKFVGEITDRFENGLDPLPTEKV